MACTELYTHYLLGDRVPGHVQGVRARRARPASVIVHDRYQNYDSAEFGELIHQLCCQHLLRDLDDAAQVYPDAVWPTQIAEALRALIHQANLARDAGRDRDRPTPSRHADRAGSATACGSGCPTPPATATRPGERKARLLLEVLRDREADVLRFAHDLDVPPTSNQAERDLRPSKIQQNISGRLTSEHRTQDRYTIRGYLSTAVKHGRNGSTVLRDALLGRPWMPTLPAPSLTSRLRHRPARPHADGTPPAVSCGKPPGQSRA